MQRWLPEERIDSCTIWLIYPFLMICLHYYLWVLPVKSCFACQTIHEWHAAGGLEILICLFQETFGYLPHFWSTLLPFSWRNSIKRANPSPLHQIPQSVNIFIYQIPGLPKNHYDRDLTMCLKFGKAVWNMTWKKGLPTWAIFQLQPKVNEFALFTLDIATTKPNHPGTSIIHKKADCFSFLSLNLLLENSSHLRSAQPGGLSNRCGDEMNGQKPEPILW